MSLFLLRLYRLALVALTAAVTTCMTCSCLFPLFRWGYTTSYATKYRTAYYYFYFETSSLPATGLWISERRDSRNFLCEPMRNLYGAASGLAVAATAMGGAATFLGSAWISVAHTPLLGGLIFALTALSFLCAVVVVALMGYAYNNDFCAGDINEGVIAPSANGFHLAVGFRLLCAAVVGFFLSTVVQAVGFCFACQLGSKKTVRDSAPVQVAVYPVYGRVQEATVVVGAPQTTRASLAAAAAPAGAAEALKKSEGRVMSNPLSKDTSGTHSSEGGVALFPHETDTCKKAEHVDVIKLEKQA